MPLRTPTSIVSASGWPRGLNRDASELLIGIDETPDCLNVDFDLRGGAKVRDGHSITYTNPSETDTYQFLMFYPSTSGDRVVAVQEDGDIWAGTSPTSQLTDTTNSFGTAAGRRTFPIEAAALDDQLYLFSQRGNTWRYDGTTWTEITDTTLNEGGTAATPEAPRAATAATHLNRIFAGNVYEGGNNYRSRLFWSETPVDNSGDAAGNRWKATSFIDVSEDDGTQIRKVASFQSSLVIFKDHSIHVLTGVDEASFALVPIEGNVGTAAPHSVAFDETSLYFFDRDEGVYLFDGVRVHRIDQAINDYLLDGIAYGFSYKAKGIISDGKYFLSVPWGSGTEYNTRTFVFDPRLGAWSEYDIGWFDHMKWSGVEYVTGHNDQEGIYTFRQGATSDDAEDGSAQAINWHLETAWIPEFTQQGMTEHRLRRLDLWTETTASTYTLDLYIDGEYTTVKSYTVTPDTSRIRLPGYPKYWSRIKLRFYGSVT